jgi:SAM-dependent methyltransferase
MPLFMSDHRNLVPRQLNRYYPSKSDPYHESNIAVSLQLDRIRPMLCNRKILDIGAGEIPFKTFYEGLNATTCDIQQNSQGTIDHIISPGEPLPWPNNEYDAIFLFDVMEHVKDDISFIKECTRLLTPDGILLLTIPFMYRFHEQPFDYRRYTPSGIAYLLSDVAGLNVDFIEPLGSVLFVMRQLLAERGFPVFGFRKVFYALLARFLATLTICSEISFGAPFGYFVLASKSGSSRSL